MTLALVLAAIIQPHPTIWVFLYSEEGGFVEVPSNPQAPWLTPMLSSKLLI